MRLKTKSRARPDSFIINSLSYQIPETQHSPTSNHTVTVVWKTYFKESRNLGEDPLALGGWPAALTIWDERDYNDSHMCVASKKL